MTTYLVTFKPTEPYFFGNEKNFIYSKENDKAPLANRYFIKSESVPSQSTVLGALRYLLLPVKKSDWNYSQVDKDVNKEAVGEAGFSPNGIQCFGKIKKISPVFLTDSKNFYVPTPFDHIEGQRSYTSFSEFAEVNIPGNKKRLIAQEYKAKDGVTSSYMNLTDGSVVPAYKIFKRVSRTGINRLTKDYFKKEYCSLNNKFSFAVYLTLEDSIRPSDDVLFLGQGKSAFSFKFKIDENCLCDEIKKCLRDDIVYCFGDSFIDPSVYEISKFSVTKTKNYRFYERKKNRVTKDTYLYRLITAGSVFIPEDKEEFLKLTNNKNANQIGYNEFITK